MIEDRLKTQENIREIIDEAETPDFEYLAPQTVRIKVLVSQAAGHVMARDRLLPQAQAAKIQGHPQHEALAKDAQLHKLCLGRIWLQLRELGVTQDDFRDKLDEELLLATPR